MEAMKDVATLAAWGFSPFDFTVEGTMPQERTLFATHLDIVPLTELSFQVASKDATKKPHVVKHDSVQPTECDCEYFVHKMAGWLADGKVPPKSCAHFMRASLVLLKRATRELANAEEAKRSLAPLNDSGKTFRLLK